MRNTTIHRIILLLFLIVIFFSIFFGLGLLVGSGFDNSVSLYLLAHLIAFILGISIYAKLWRISKSEGNEKHSLFPLWMIMVLFFTSVPAVFYFSIKISNDKNREDNLLYETQHCQEIATKQHKYRLKKCENGNLIGDLTSVEEYTRETK